MAERIFAVDENFDFPAPVAARQAARLGDATTAEGAALAAAIDAGIAAYMAGIGQGPHPIDAWVHWGDSMTAAGSSGNWVGRFAALTGLQHQNGGIGGESSSQIRTRALAGSAYRDRKFTISAGRNNYSTSTPAQIVADIQAIIDNFNVAKKGFVFDIAPWVGEPLPAVAGGSREKLEAANSALKTAFPSLYFPVFAKLRTDEAATVTGITWSAQDLTDIANGYTPLSFRSDSGHLNHIGGRAVAYFVAAESRTRGYSTPMPTAATPYAVLNGGFESGISPWGNVDGTLTHSTVEYRSGTKSGAMTFAASPSSALSYPFSSPFLPVAPGKLTEFSLQIKAPAGHVTRMLIHEYADAVFVKTTPVIGAVSTGAWAALSSELTLSSTTTNVRVQINKAPANPDSTEVIYVDELRAIRLN